MTKCRLPRHVQRNRIQQTQRVLPFDRGHNRAGKAHLAEVNDFRTEGVVHETNQAVVRLGRARLEVAVFEKPVVQFQVIRFAAGIGGLCREHRVGGWRVRQSGFSGSQREMRILRDVTFNARWFGFPGSWPDGFLLPEFYRRQGIQAAKGFCRGGIRLCETIQTATDQRT